MNVIKTEYGVENGILYNLDEYVGKSLELSDAGITPNAMGKKVVLAGSIVDNGGAIVDDATAVGVVLNDVDVTSGPCSGTVIYRGTVNDGLLPVQSSAAVRAAIKGITFVNASGEILQ